MTGAVMSTPSRPTCKHVRCSQIAVALVIKHIRDQGIDLHKAMEDARNEALMLANNEDPAVSDHMDCVSSLLEQIEESLL